MSRLRYHRRKKEFRHLLIPLTDEDHTRLLLRKGSMTWPEFLLLGGDTWLAKVKKMVIDYEIEPKGRVEIQEEQEKTEHEHKDETKKEAPQV